MKTISITLLALLSALTLAASAADKTRAPGEKLDSSLGDLPHYRHWSDPTGKNPVPGPMQIAGEKLDNGLGDLPHYRHWNDPTGKTPLRSAQIVAASETRP